jgi:hypothetical protein
MYQKRYSAHEDSLFLTERANYSGPATNGHYMHFELDTGPLQEW